ncbi:hypothetical protein CcrC1_gp250c [Caulobacter phage C1]|nr:hypothetical protein CcrC1_gp250c [Caulobacter phage C1]UTU08479.1 hypothetical protein CcrC2_gp251c [Caulobacter phage C2]UTU08994.1 hypothetical protein CcrJ4_gp245c [Caulobacter phage J4]UTU10112.1 hypothetical protein CcrRB23_gp250c [Caulobacter phage RB23]WGN97147.1 hypothetical protein [Bertelyvirus sp.]
MKNSRKLMVVALGVASMLACAAPVQAQDDYIPGPGVDYLPATLSRLPFAPPPQVRGQMASLVEQMVQLRLGRVVVVTSMRAFRENDDSYSVCGIYLTKDFRAVSFIYNLGSTKFARADKLYQNPERGLREAYGCADNTGADLR